MSRPKGSKNKPRNGEELSSVEEVIITPTEEVAADTDDVLVEKIEPDVEEITEEDYEDPKAHIKVHLVELEKVYEAMKAHGVRSISDIEVKISQVRSQL